MNNQTSIVATYIPAKPQPKPEGSIVVTAPNDKRGFPVFPKLFLTVRQASDLIEALEAALFEVPDEDM